LGKGKKEGWEGLGAVPDYVLNYLGLFLEMSWQLGESVSVSRETCHFPNELPPGFWILTPGSSN